MDQTIEVEVDLNSSVNFAMQQNEVAILRSLRLTNCIPESLDGLTVEIETEPQFAQPWTTSLDKLDAGETRAISPIDLRLSSSFLWQVSERLVGSVVVQVSRNGEVLVRHSAAIEVLAHDEWPGLGVLPEILAAFVLPNHPAVEQVLSKASALLREWTGDGSLSGYQSKERERVLYMGAAIFGALQQVGIAYSNPPASFEQRGQKVRLPDRIVQNRLGSCLDLSAIYAACLEQAGLFPLIILLEGHAFSGFWLIEESFQDCAVEDPLSVRKRVDLGEICLVETTLLTQTPPVQFEQAAERGKARLADLSKFCCAIDIQRARKNRIRPIALQPTGEVTLPVGTDLVAPEIVGMPSHAPEIPSSLVSGVSSAGASSVPSEPPAARLEKWKRKLLDLSLRNRLLNFRDSKKTLRILSPDLGSLEDALADGEKFQILPNLDKLDANGVRSQEIFVSRIGQDGVQEILKEEFRAKRLHGAVSQAELDRRLLEIYRAAKTSLEEGGSSALYLALGFLEWYESPSSQIKRSAPIILIPLVLERHSVQEGFRLHQSDEEPRINTTLLEMLQQDHEVTIEHIDPIPVDEHGIDVACILRSFREAVRDIPRWDVSEEAQIGLFSFAKYLMWLDLQVRAADLRKNKVVSHLIDSPQCPFGTTADFPNPCLLDEAYPPSDTFCPLDCDSSQLAAVHAADEEKSFVLEGPPGTGKSQTITNIIAHCLAKGKSVLFVSEKMAALNVVHTRLTQVGLGPFCLALHSNKAQKAQVVEQLGASLDLARTMSSDDWTRLSGQLAASRAELNRYVSALHAKRESGESIFQGLSKLTALRDVVLVDLGWPKDFTPDGDFLRQLREVTDRLRVAGESIGHPCGNVWAASSCESWTPSLVREMESSLAQMSALLPEVLRRASEAGALLGMGESGWSLVELERLAEVGKFLMSSPAPPQTLLVSQDWDSAKTAISDWIGHGRKRDDLRAQVYSKYSEAVLHFDLQPIEKRLNEAHQAWGPFRWLKTIGLKRALKPMIKPGQIVLLESLDHEIELIRALKKEEYLLSKAGEEARGLLGQLLWKDGEADWAGIEQAQGWADQFSKLVTLAGGTDLDRIQGFRKTWSRIATEGKAALGADQAIGRILSNYCAVYSKFAEACRAIESKASLDPHLAWASSEQQDALPRMTETLETWKHRLPDFQGWCNWRRVRRDAMQTNLSAIVKAYESGLFSTADVERVISRSYYEWWVNNQIEREPVLAEFFSPEHERKIGAFRELDAAYTRLAQQQIQALLSAKIPSPQGQAAGPGEVGILLRQRGRRRGVMPIRSLFQSIPNLLPRLKPCLLMSPLSVAQYLDPSHPPFDLVVFDEASQIPVWDAVGAIARGREVIIVGDPKQLPPTSFFNRSDNPDEVDEDAVEDLESILDDCMAAQLPLHRLDWHYRSRHESLIAFSNQQYYGNRLLTFPSPHREIGVSWHSVPTGVYDRAGTRANRVEAEAVVAEVCRRLLDPHLSRFSIGIVTFSIAQQALIEDLLEAARRKDPSVDQGFSDERPEPVFVKNLENVQGDERDVILFSICYGPDAMGRVAMNFGPLNKLGGERRLNVAITRARRELLVFSTLRSDQIDLQRTRATGVADLKSFLDFAERGQQALREASGPTAHTDFESPFEKDVCEALRAHGHRLDVQVGCSGYRIDLAVIDPKRPGRYLLGIECDGAFYHSAHTARDRDRLRQAILIDLGWKLHRVWSSDWWNNREATLAKIEAAIVAAESPSPPNTASPDSAPQDRYAAVPAAVPISTERQPDTPPIATVPAKTSISTAEVDFETYQPHPPLPISGVGADFYAPPSDAAITAAINAIVRHEGPVSLHLCARKVMEAWGLKRMTPAVLSRIGECISAEGLRSQVCSYGTFLWPSTLLSAGWSGLRLPGSSEDSFRDVEDLPPEEIANGARYILSQQVAMPVAALVKETARLFGIHRLGRTVDQVMQDGIALLVQTGRAKQSGEDIALP
jgi:very-short-patch-repair endonuclease